MENFVGEIRLFPYQFVPYGWAKCDGTMLVPQQNAALFALIGTQFGGNGTTTFALPDLRGRVPLGATQVSPSAYPQGATGGAVNATLATANLPAHTHQFKAASAVASSTTPAGNFFAGTSDNEYASGTAVTMAANMLATTGTAAPVSNVQPYLGLIFAIAKTGVYPPRD